MQNDTLSSISGVFGRRETLFERVASEVERLILTGQWKVGELLPNEVELAARFQVSQGTVRRALRILVDKGILIRQQGRGTFVSDYRLATSAVAGRYVRLIPDNGEPELPTVTKVHVFEVLEAANIPLVAAVALGLRGKEKVVHVTRAHLVVSDGVEKPVSFDEHFLSTSVFSRLTYENMSHHRDRVLYTFYQNVCGVTIAAYEEAVKAALLEDDWCRLYGIEPPEPILIGRRTAYTLGSRPVEYRIQRYMTSQYHFLIRSS